MLHGETRGLRLERIDADRCISGTRYDLLVGVLGFESRARHLSTRLDYARAVVHDYSTRGTFDYEVNRAHFEAAGATIMPSESFAVDLEARLAAMSAERVPEEGEGDGPLRLAVDISCMDRDLIATTALVLRRFQRLPLVVDFFYSFGAFDASLVGSEGSVMVNRPVAGLEGWSSNPELGLACILGLGFESRLALAAIETLEPKLTLALVPAGEDDDFDRVVRDRNAVLIGKDPNAGRRVYAVNDIYQTTMDLDATVTALARRYRVVVVPLGPKTFALSAILVGIAHPRNVTIWRLSADRARRAENRMPTGAVFGVRLHVVGQQDE